MSSEATELTIGDLAERTGVSAATVRMWEQRHGFPVPQRLSSGHRRYSVDDAEAVQAVARLRDGGVRLDLAIARVGSDREPAAPSVYAVLRRRHAGLGVHRLRKSTLLALSWAIEDEFCAKAHKAEMWGSFQKQQYYEAAHKRWADIASTSAQTTVFADFEQSDTSSTPRKVSLPADAPMRREWAVVCDSEELPVVLTAWELPGQTGVPDLQRVFESVWTVDGAAVRDAARVCATVAATHGVGDGPQERSPASTPDLAATTALFNRMVGYVDRY